jgi:hypothetical protein
VTTEQRIVEGIAAFCILYWTSTALWLGWRVVDALEGIRRHLLGVSIARSERATPPARRVPIAPGAEEDADEEPTVVTRRRDG